ncbi:MAG: FCD domain-containing protein [Parasphingorhabdus sp.]|uniref:FCD domain-containing protein n=1 Tax=Parasphingorhabdus sp. TaxID=2709688 RepID=UPI003263DF61
MVSGRVLEGLAGGRSSVPQDIAGEDAASFAVYRQLRSDITRCVLKPDEKLRFEALRKTYGAGIGTLREALSHLVSDGLVRIDVGRGFRVAPVSVEDLEDITFWRIEFESRAISGSIRNGDDNWEAGIVSAFHLLSKSCLPDSEATSEQWMSYGEKHTHFHDTLVASCGSPWLLFFRSALQSQAQRYQAFAMSHRDQIRYRLTDEHRVIMQAVVDRDEQAAIALISDHIQQTTDDVKKLLKQSGAIPEFSVGAGEKSKPRPRGRPRKAG